MESFKKTVYVGDTLIGKRHAKVFVTIENNNGRLSITGVEGPLASGNCRGSFGQISLDNIDRLNISGSDLARLKRVWQTWHLNDMQAGSPDQTRKLGHNGMSFDQASEYLRRHGLNPDPNYLHNGKPYAYGSAWLAITVPEIELEWLGSLPHTSSPWGG